MKSLRQTLTIPSERRRGLPAVWDAKLAALLLLPRLSARNAYNLQILPRGTLCQPELPYWIKNK